MSIFGDEYTVSDQAPQEEREATQPEAQSQDDESVDHPYEEQDHSFEGGGEDSGDFEELDDEPDDPEQAEQSQGDARNVEELARAYQELERQSRQPESAQQPITPQVPQADPNQVFWQHFQQDPFGTMQYLIQNAVTQHTEPIQKQRQSEQLSRNIEAISKEYKQVGTEDGLTKLFGKVSEIAEELGNPALAKNPTQRVLRMAAAEAFRETKQQLYNQAKAAGRKEAESARRQKRNLGAPSGTKQTQNEEPKTEADLIRESIVAAGRGSSIFG
ncbi:hypothetical protein [Paenibacillus chitinolyticus]|uniref:hypothetical protein n=1 Tax=Paenibacillus chitinolyticus TaxID=79263 RepID=UPI003655F1FD